MKVVANNSGVHDGSKVVVKAAHQGAAAGAREPIRPNHELVQLPDFAIDDAYEEYVRLVETGSAPDPYEYCDRFPEFRSSLFRLLEVHTHLDEREQAGWPEPGQVILTFRILRLLGYGTFGQTFLAIDEATNRPVAIKLTTDANDESRVLGPLTHANIVSVFSAFQDAMPGRNAVVMPYYGAATLHNLLDIAFPQPGPMPRRAGMLAEAIGKSKHANDPELPLAPVAGLASETYVDSVVRLLAEIAEALDYLHRNGIVHRDLKLSNVLIGDDGKARLLDFNMSCGDRTSHPLQGGTLPYMAPEQVEPLVVGKPAVLDGRTDIFAWGVIAYQLLSGELPFGTIAGTMTVRPHPDLKRAARAHLDRLLAGANELRGVPAELSALIGQCLRLDRAARPESASVVAAKLRAILDAPRRRRRLRRLTASAILIAGLVAFGSWGILTRLGSAPTTSEPAQDFSRLATTAMAAENYVVAETMCDRQLSGKPDDLAARAMRGLARLKLGSASSAISDFLKVYEDAPSQELAARIAYCCALLNDDIGAIRYANEAMERGAPSAGLFNLRGYCQYNRALSNPGPGGRILLEKALQDFSLAIAVDPAFASPRLNRALVAFRYHERYNLPLSQQAVADIDTAISLRPDVAYFHYAASRLLAAESGAVGPNRDKILQHLGRSIQLGISPSQYTSDDIFAPLRNDPSFVRAASVALTPSVSDRSFRLVDPVDHTCP